MKYKFTRKISPKRFFPEMNFESVDFGVDDADTPEEAMEAVEDWISEWIDATKKKIESINNKPPFESKEITDKFGNKKDSFQAKMINNK